MALRKTISILERFLAGKSSVEEEARIDKWYDGIEEPELEADQIEGVKEELYERIRKGLEETPVVPLYRKSIFKIAVAASIILVLGVGGYFAFFRSTLRQAQGDSGVVAKANDVEAPKETRAVITLANGDKVYLDSAGNGTIAQENNVHVIKTADGKIVYDANSQQLIANSPVYNTLTNPRGSKVIDMTLSDGSHVWLNAGSSVTYPVAFVGNERTVEITGEAYFEVAHIARPFKAGEGNKKTQGFSPMPFFVKSGNVTTEVLGTHFNINSYADEEGVKVTLLEGSVKVSANFSNSSAPSAFIKPGQQAMISNPANPSIRRILVQDNVDVEQVMAWKNGTFDFDGADLQTIMRQIARWYDVDVIYQGNVTKEAFRGEINRNVPVSKVLQMLEYLGMKFSVEGKKIVVLK